MFRASANSMYQHGQKEKLPRHRCFLLPHPARTFSSADSCADCVHSSIQYLAALRTLLSLAQWRWQLARRPALYLCRLSTICLRFRASFSSLAQGRQKLALRTFVSLAQWRRKLGRRAQLYILMLCIGFFYGRMTRRAAWTPYR